VHYYECIYFFFADKRQSDKVISVIICSRALELPLELQQNIAHTIGMDYEFVIVNNANNERNIFEAYNEGVRLAKGDILCFMHDDILFRSTDWGKVVNKAFENKICGLVGVIGCQFLSNRVQPWWHLGHHLGCITQGYFENGEYRTLQDGESLQEESKEGVAVDGLWFCVRRKLFDTIRFDDITFDNFHCYDVDTCMQVIEAGYQVRVLRDVKIEHKSGGNASSEYFVQMDRFVNKWGRKLPISRGLGWGKMGTILYQWYRNIGNR